MEFADKNPEYVIVVASSMGQTAAFGNKVDTQLYLRDLPVFMASAGLSDAQWSRRPAMDPTVSVVVDEDKVAGFDQYLQDLLIAGTPFRMSAKEGGFFDLHFGQTDLDPKSDFLTLRGEAVSHAEFGFEIIEVEDEGGSTGYHIPEGILLTYDPTKPSTSAGRKQIQVTDVAPCLLDHFGLAVPSYMNPPGALTF